MIYPAGTIFNYENGEEIYELIREDKNYTYYFATVQDKKRYESSTDREFFWRFITSGISNKKVRVTLPTPFHVLTGKLLNATLNTND